ncbi:MAG: tannase/feruloyl esterase family alpha/beta hydrolase [Acidobacteria bacterium]|nr:MAG: tannase/feruloyl esterase family alpha/beta hydrolase [Acidobacteriota bacterium]REK03709.1 MAG: tannase/feruloyl esterase family alpha/beta hydrolase [Acidobacteriota bacterium]
MNAIRSSPRLPLAPRPTAGPCGGLLALMIVCAGSLAAPGRAESRCDGLAALRLPDLTVLDVTEVGSPVGHCKFDGRIGRRIGFSIWLPHEWNGGFAMGGQGGFAGSVENQALALSGGQILRQGWVTAATDTGHRASALDGSWALHDLEAIVDYGHLAVHRVTEMSKAIVAAHYGRPAETSFFLGCSNGGRQGLQEAQRYPEDYDVILAGAPALDFDGLGAAFLSITRQMYPEIDDLTQPVVTDEARSLLRAAIEDRCDARDGISDGILADPAACDFEVRSLACGEATSEGCLSAEQIGAIETIYGGPRTATGESLHVGFPFGAEDTDANGWGSWLSGRADAAGPGIPSAAYAFGTGLARYFVHHDADWSYEGYDLARWPEDARAVARTLDANDPDLDAFRARGGKLLLYHGWSDAALSANMSIGYVESVYRRDASAAEDVRLFLMPGVLHCFGGEGPAVVDWLGAMQRWHESGEPPRELEAGFLSGGGGRKLCSWPTQAVYTGDDPRHPASFTCR